MNGAPLSTDKSTISASSVDDAAAGRYYYIDNPPGKAFSMENHVDLWMAAIYGSVHHLPYRIIRLVKAKPSMDMTCPFMIPC